ncbi:MAG: type II secretion system F family protein [Gemmatimonadota bacterium]
MTIAIVLLAAVSAIFIVVAVSEAMPVRERAVGRKLAELEAIASKRTVAHKRQRTQKREQVEAWLQNFGERVAAEKSDWLSVRRKLAMAGYRNANAAAIFFGIRIVSLVAVVAGVFLLLPFLDLAGNQSLVFILAGSLMGWMLPGAIVSRKTRLRQKEIQKALPDTLDLLVVCVESGLGLNQALQRVSDEIEHISSTMAEELHIVNVEIRAGTAREDALRGLGERTDVRDLRALATMLVQTDRFGTSIATALRVHSDSLRIKRRQRAEEAAAKTTIKMIFPLAFFIFPSMFVVILGPAVLSIIAELSNVT